MKCQILAALLAIVGSVPGAQAPALAGLDPVALCEGEEMPGSAEQTARHGRYLYRFASARNRARFVAEPERWSIQWGGGCGRMGPLSGRGDSDRWAVYEQRIFIFASDDCREGFLSAPARFGERQDGVVFDAVAIGEGETWLARVVEAHGGAAAIDRPRSLKYVASGESDGWKSRRELLVSADGKVRRSSVWTPPDASDEPIQTVWVVAGTAFTCESNEIHELTSAEERADTLRYAHRQLLPLFWARQRHDFVPISRGPGMLDGRVTADLMVVWQGLSTILHIDPETSRILGLSWRGRVIDGAARGVREIFTEFRTIDDIVVPVGRKVHVDGEEKASFTWNATELLGAPAADAFARPASAE